MTNIEMKPLLESTDPQVRKLAKHYGSLFDAAQELCTCVNDTGFESSDEYFDNLCRVLDSQPNEEKKP